MVEMSLEYKDVLRGVKLLDEKLPTWRGRINWDTLDIWSLTDCVIGQLRREYRDPWLFQRLGMESFSDGVIYGFESRKSHSRSSYDRLTEAWKLWAKENII